MKINKKIVYSIIILVLIFSTVSILLSYTHNFTTFGGCQYIKDSGAKFLVHRGDCNRCERIRIRFEDRVLDRLDKIKSELKSLSKK